MQFTSLLLIAAAAGQVHWVPLDSHQARQAQGQIPSRTSRSAPAATVAPPGNATLAVAQIGAVARLLPAGTLVSLSPLQEISSKHMREGQRYPFVVVQDVVENGQIVIPRGSSATGVVTAQTGRAIGGKSGKFDISFEEVVANGARFPLTGVSRQEGKGNTIGALFGLIFISGRSATLLPGQVVTAFTSQPTPY